MKSSLNTSVVLFVIIVRLSIGGEEAQNILQLKEIKFVRQSRPLRFAQSAVSIFTKDTYRNETNNETTFHALINLPVSANTSLARRFGSDETVVSRKHHHHDESGECTKNLHSLKEIH
jgi:hypothetical protein